MRRSFIHPRRLCRSRVPVLSTATRNTQFRTNDTISPLVKFIQTSTFCNVKHESSKIATDTATDTATGTATSTATNTGTALTGNLASVCDTLSTLQVNKHDSSMHTLNVVMNRPEFLNAMNKKFWYEIRQLFDVISSDYENDIRVVVLTGSGKHFTAGLDLQDHVDLLAPSNQSNQDIGRKSIHLQDMIKSYQQAFTSIEQCRKPVITVVHGGCIGGGVDLICSADIRICTSDAFFCIKEAEIGLAADVGTLQRLPRIVGNDSLVRELAYTARRMHADEARQCGLVSGVFSDKQNALNKANEIARKIASLSPVAVQGTKYHLNYSREHGIQQGLEHQAIWNSAMLQTNDLVEAAQASLSGSKPVYPKL